MQNHSKLIYAILTLCTTMTIASCKKDRIKEPLAAYTPINTYLDSKKQDEQEFIITGPSNDTIIGKQGTRIYGSKSCLRNSNGDTIDYPFSIKLVELYTPSDMIYYQMPTVANGNILETAGEIRLRATQNGQDLTLSCPYAFEMKNSTPKSSMTIYTGSDNGTFVDWTNTSTPFSLTNYGYLGVANTFGWFNTDTQVGTGTGNSITFTSITDDLTNVGIFIYFPVTKTIMQVYNKVSGLIPTGSNVKIVLIGIKSTGEIFNYTAHQTIGAATTLDVTLTATTDANLTAFLNGL